MDSTCQVDAEHSFVCLCAGFRWHDHIGSELVSLDGSLAATSLIEHGHGAALVAASHEHIMHLADGNFELAARAKDQLLELLQTRPQAAQQDSTFTI